MLCVCSVYALCMLVYATENKEKLEKEQRNLPLRIETPSMVKKSKELENKLKEVEEAIAMFNRKKVYVAE